MRPMEPPKCEHHWVSQHQPGHEIYWVLVCSICHEPNWDALDEAITEEKARAHAAWWASIIGFKAFGSIYDPKDVTIVLAGYKQGVRMPDLQLIETAKNKVYEYALKHLDKTDEIGGFSIENVYVVWFCKILQNWKALVSTDLLDGCYYEVTYDGATGMIYLDVYKKFDNIEINNQEALLYETPELERLRSQWSGTTLPPRREPLLPAPPAVT